MDVRAATPADVDAIRIVHAASIGLSASRNAVPFYAAHGYERVREYRQVLESRIGGRLRTDRRDDEGDVTDGRRLESDRISPGASDRMLDRLE